ELPGAGAPPQCLVSTEPLIGTAGYETCPTDPDNGPPFFQPYEVAIMFMYPATDPDIQPVSLVTQAPEPGTAWSYNMGCPCMGGLPVTPEDLTDWNFCTDCST